MSVGNQSILAPEVEFNRGFRRNWCCSFDSITASSLLSLPGIHSSPISHDRGPILQTDIAKDTKHLHADSDLFVHVRSYPRTLVLFSFIFFCRLIILCLPVFVWFPISISILLLHANWDHNGGVCYDFTALTSGWFLTHSLRISRDSSVILVFLSCLLVTVFNIFIYISYTLGFLFV